MTPSQKRQRGRTNREGASNAAPSGSNVASRGKTLLKKDATRKGSRPAQRKREKNPEGRQMKEPCLKVTLPGDLYERSGQWWWRTKLPGENKAKTRQLKAPETGEAVCDRDTAERIAVQMWEQAVQENGTRQITRDCAEKVERLKAQFLDKVRQLTVIVESANARAQAEAQARTEIEARLNAVLQTSGQKTIPMSPAQTQNQVPPQVLEQAIGWVAPSDRLPRETPAQPCAPVPASTVTENADPQPQTGICECCGAPEVLVSDLEAIDSGQLLCPDCIAALHTDVSRIDAKDFSASRA